MLVVGHPTDTHPSCPPATDYVTRLREAFLAAVAADDGPRADALGRTLDTADRAPQSLSGAAQWYVARGWPVFPLTVGGKAPATSRGFLQASTDPDRVGAWWSAHPESNIGIPTGVRFDVIDVDYRTYPGAMHVWASIKDLFEAHGMVSTPRGVHVYTMPAGAQNGTGAGGVAGLDYRGRGGYVVVPPSVRPDGRYVWWSPPSPSI